MCKYYYIYKAFSGGLYNVIKVTTTAIKHLKRPIIGYSFLSDRDVKSVVIAYGQLSL